VVGNPNIRYLILGGPESEGHLTGEALRALLVNGVDEKKRIIGTSAPHPFLFNLSTTMIDRFREQLSPIDLQFEGDPEAIRKAVWSCYQESPVTFREYELHDPGAYPEPPLGGNIMWRVTQPWVEPASEEEREAVDRTKKMMEELRRRGRGQGR
jgi:tetrahydromethanopterin S-methyltransferase subunit A